MKVHLDVLVPGLGCLSRRPRRSPVIVVVTLDTYISRILIERVKYTLKQVASGSVLAEELRSSILGATPAEGHLNHAIPSLHGQRAGEGRGDCNNKVAPISLRVVR